MNPLNLSAELDYRIGPNFTNHAQVLALAYHALLFLSSILLIIHDSVALYMDVLKTQTGFECRLVEGISSWFNVRLDDNVTSSHIS